MTELPPELRKLPPKALDVLRFLGTQPAGASVSDIISGTGLSDRGCRKAIRRLVTRYYLEMPEREYYTLSARGQEAVQTLRALDDATTTPVFPSTSPSSRPGHARRLSIFLPKALAVGLAAKFQVGFGPPLAESVPLRQAAQVVLKLSVPHCDVQPPEHVLEVTNEQGAVGPVGFRVQAERAQKVRVELTVYQRTAAPELLPLGGMFFDLEVTEFPTPDSAALQTLAVVVQMYEDAAS